MGRKVNTLLPSGFAHRPSSGEYGLQAKLSRFKETTGDKLGGPDRLTVTLLLGHTIM